MPWFKHRAPLPSEESLHNRPACRWLAGESSGVLGGTSVHWSFCFSTANCTAVHSMSKKGVGEKALWESIPAE
eukprot:12918097-Prorocentrum_lima.AAC.1